MTEQQPTGVPAPEGSQPTPPAPTEVVPAIAPEAVTAPAEMTPAAPAPADVVPPAAPAPADVASVPVAAVVPVAVEPAPAKPVHRKRDRILGSTGQVLGVIGMLVCIVLIVGVIFGRSYAVGTVNDVAAAVDTQIAKVSPILQQAHTTVGEVSGKVSTVAEIADTVAKDPNPGGQIAQALRDAIDGVNDRYQALRQGYAGIRETALSIIEKLQTVDQLIPGLAIPQGPIDALNTFDTRIQEFDAKVNDLLTIEPGNGPANQAAAKIAEAATAIDGNLQFVQDGITQVDDRVTQLRTDIANTADTVNLIITLVTIFILLLLIWLLILHWILFRHSGEIRRKTVAR